MNWRKRKFLRVGLLSICSSFHLLPSFGKPFLFFPPPPHPRALAPGGEYYLKIIRRRVPSSGPSQILFQMKSTLPLFLSILRRNFPKVEYFWAIFLTDPSTLPPGNPKFPRIESVECERQPEGSQGKKASSRERKKETKNFLHEPEQLFQTLFFFFFFLRVLRL